MITTTYSCDRCGHSQPDSEQMWSLGIMLEHRQFTPYWAGKAAAVQVLWCRKCVESICLLKAAMGAREAKPAHVPETPPTFEEMIREIVREEVRS